MTKRIPLLFILQHHQNAKKDAARTRIFDPARHYGTVPGIAMAPTNAQDTKGKALSLQDDLCLVGFIV
jgi:hypothetical protein